MKIAANRMLYYRPNKSEGKRRVQMPKMWNNDFARRQDRKRLHNRRTSGGKRISQETNNKMQQLRKPDPPDRLRLARLTNAERRPTNFLNIHPEDMPHWAIAKRLEDAEKFSSDKLCN